MLSIKVTKLSRKILEQWHEGSGRVFMSDGSGKCVKSFDIVFRKNLTGHYILSFGNSKCVRLTPDQIAEIGNFAEIEKE